MKTKYILKKLFNSNPKIMKTKLLTTTLFAFCMAMILNTVDAQEKQIKIVKKGDGNEDVRVISSPDELDAETMQLLKEQGIDLDNLSDIKHEKHYKIVVKDEDGESKTVEWDGNGEMPEELKEHLEDLDIDIIGDGKMMFIKAEGAEAIGDEEIEMDVDIIKLVEGEAGEEGDVKKKVRIKVIDDNGEVKEMEWNGEGEMPEEMKGYMDMGKCDDGNKWVHEVKVKKYGAEGGVQLGVMIEKDDEGAIRITDSVEGSGAAEAGLQSEDIIQYLNGAPVTDFDQLVELVNANEAGDVVVLGIIRDGKAQDVDVRLSEKKAVKVMVKKIEKEVECTKEELEKCKKVCTKEEIEECLKKMKEEEGAAAQEEVIEEVEDKLVMPRNNLKLKGFSAFPNPTDGILNIEFQAEESPVIVQVLDASGRTLFKDTVNNFGGVYKNQFNLTDQTSGQFYVSIIQDQKVFTQQVIVN